MTAFKSRNISIDRLRGIACLLITNSHCGQLYPSPFLALGGGWGNTMFMSISGFCLAEPKLPFPTWLAKRYARILPVTIFIGLLGTLFVDLPSGNLSLPLVDIAKLYIDRYWFIAALALYYPIIYWISRSQNKRFQLAFIATYISAYCILYISQLESQSLFVEAEGFSFFKVYSYFGIMMLGTLLAKRTCSKSSRIPLVGYVGISALGLAVWSIGYILTLFANGYPLQFLIVLGNALLAIGTIQAANILPSEKGAKMSGAGRALIYLSTSTLEIYLIQVTFNKFFVIASFPINVVAFFVLVIGCGIIAHNVLSHFTRLCHL